ncbi:SURF1 family protein [Oceanibacterium hippocampi]|uniref:SURF1-like protein n=1 Tax=Oceanibacterium hippocampi TaxID=745714 RepID=A0A1Y5S6V2_9PROT|nr:SURF1 family protein [Oceanibacterium hippocampi]SLN33301.1 SURF1 family protein [Oceanibacterium hippocampi]
MQFRPLLWPTVIALPLFIVTLWLGTWQVQRLFWKTDLIQRIESGLAADPAPLPAGAIDPDDWFYRRVSVDGVFDHAAEIHLLAHAERGRLGYHVITPLERSDGGGWVLVNRGWVPEERKDPATRAEGQVAGVQHVDGVARKSWKVPWLQGLILPDNDIAENLWFFGDIDQMAEHLGREVAPVFVEADGTANPGDWPRGGQTVVSVPNRHLEYAITWYGMAIALLVIYLLYHRKEERL